MNYHTLTPKQKGGLGEALLTSHTNATKDAITEWVEADVSKRVGDNIGDVKVEHDTRVETYYVNFEGAHMSWTPDCLFTAWIRRRFGALQSSDELRLDYPIEIKTGKYAELERNQREVMELLSTEFDIVPVLANVDLSLLPDEFGVSFTPINSE